MSKFEVRCVAEARTDNPVGSLVQGGFETRKAARRWLQCKSGVDGEIVETIDEGGVEVLVMHKWNYSLGDGYGDFDSFVWIDGMGWLAEKLCLMLSQHAIEDKAAALLSFYRGR